MRRYCPTCGMPTDDEIVGNLVFCVECNTMKGKNDIL